MINIEKIIKRAKKGDKEAFCRLILDVQPDLIKYAKTRFDQKEDVEDVIQNTIEKTYKNIHQLKNIKYFKTWITSILINECNKMYKKQKEEAITVQAYINNIDNTNDDIDNILFKFNDIIKILDDTDQKIFYLRYEEKCSIKEIATEFNMNENTIKTILYRGRQKIKEKLKKTSIIAIILCIFLIGGVIAISLVNILKNYFELKSIGGYNDGVLMAIENLDWYQTVDMDYIELGEGNKIRIEYILLDEMCLYMVVDFQSEKDISKYTNISLPDLTITNEKGEVICNRKNILAEQSRTEMGDKLIEKGNNNIKSLIYMYADELPISKTLNIDFTKTVLYGKKRELELKSNIHLQIDVDEKFLNPTTSTYSSNYNIIKKALTTNTGFYAIVETSSINKSEVYLKDEIGNTYNCDLISFTKDNVSSSYNRLIISNFNDINKEKITLVLGNTEIELHKK